MTAQKAKSGSSSKSTKDALYDKIGKFFKAHPEAVDMNLEESDKLFETWLRSNNIKV
jgi:hypothetical protein